MWQGAAIFIGLLVAIASFLGLFFGPWLTVGLIVLGLLAMLIHHLIYMGRLLRWLQGPLEAPVPDGWGMWAEAFVGLHRRVRIRLEQQQQLSEAVDRFRRAGEALPDGVVILDHLFQIEALNQKAARHLGLDLQQDRGHCILNVVRDPEFVTYLETGKFDEPLPYKSPRVVGQSLLVQVIPYGNEQLLLLTRDISQVERLERMRRDFVANVSHELKTPLTVVSGFVEMIADNYGEFDSEEILRYLGLIREQSARMQRLIEDLLALSALETGQSAPHDEKIDLHQLLETLLREAEALSNGRHQFTIQASGPMTLLGCANELRSAFSNLASNAVRYTPAGGKIDIAWNGAQRRFSVTDTGIGIATEHIPRLTERFYRVDRSRSRETGGTGLGLAIVKHVLTRHQAVLDVRSEPGKGSTFAAELPPDRVVDA